jgi:hypothetical protein
MNSTLIDNEKLMPWYHAVHWAGLVLQQHIKQLEAADLDATLHRKRLAELTDLEQFLSMSWDVWMDLIAKTPEEVK